MRLLAALCLAFAFAIALGLWAPLSSSPPRLPAAAEEATPALVDHLRFPPGEVVLFSGEMRLEETYPGSEPEVARYRVSVLYRVEGQTERTTRLLVARVLRPLSDGSGGGAGSDTKSNGPGESGDEDVSEDLETLAALERIAIGTVAGRLEVGVLGEEQYELEAVLPELAIRLPFEALFPDVLLPESGATLARDETIPVFHLARVESRLETRFAGVDGAAAAPGVRRVSRRLAAGARPTFRVEESPAALTRWDEEYDLDATRPGTLARVSRELAVEVGDGERKASVAASLVLERQSAAVPPPEMLGRLEALERSFDAVARLLADRKPSAEVAPGVASFAKAARGTLYADLASVLRVRLHAYRALFEESANGRRLALVLGKQAPDFTLQDLDGRKVGFRQAIAGKVTLLTFWGVG